VWLWRQRRGRSVVVKCFYSFFDEQRQVILNSPDVYVLTSSKLIFLHESIKNSFLIASCSFIHLLQSFQNHYMTSISCTQLSSLSNEILLLIIEKLDDLNSVFLFQLRLVSQRFNTLITSQFYHSVIINSLLFTYSNHDELDITCRDRILINIRTHTKRVSIRRSLNWKEMLDLILFMKHFTALR